MKRLPVIIFLKDFLHNTTVKTFLVFAAIREFDAVNCVA